MAPEVKIKKRTIRDRIWHPKEEDFISFKVFQMISIPLIMVLSIAMSIFWESPIWTLLMIIWLFVALGLGLIASFRYKIINSTKDKNSS